MFPRCQFGYKGQEGPWRLLALSVVSLKLETIDIQVKKLLIVYIVLWKNTDVPFVQEMSPKRCPENQR